jgi:hypothetical protein
MEPIPTRDGFLALLGEPPAERPPLDVEVLSEADHEGYTLERIAYATVPGERVQAYLLLPRGNGGQKPGVLAIHSNKMDRGTAPLISQQVCLGDLDLDLPVQEHPKQCLLETLAAGMTER